MTARGDGGSGWSPALQVGIIGGGASGALVAARLLRDTCEPLAITVYEPRARLGDGIAYSTMDDAHLLNVPASGMSALVEEPTHFENWADAAPGEFVPRRRYGDYLRSILADSLASAPTGSGLTHIRERVVNLGFEPCPWAMTAHGGFTSFDHLVLATGHDASSIPAAVAAVPEPRARIVLDPWALDWWDDVVDGETIVLVGTGLTAVDIALTLARRAPRARLVLVSRHGLLPQSHDDPWQPGFRPPKLPIPGTSPRDVIRFVRSHGARWRQAVDSLRSLTPLLWQSWTQAERESYMRHVSRFWDVHRHRMAPQVARQFEELQSAGRLRVVHGGLTSVHDLGDGLRVQLVDDQCVEASHLVLCTGPTGMLANDPLGSLIVARRQAQAGPLGIGYDVAPGAGSLINANGEVNARSSTVGVLRRGTLGESTAMPEIRQQALEISSALLSERRTRAEAS